MYNFIDTTESPGSASLPSEALKLNGQYIENIIPGYRTLNVSGRELLECEIDDYENGNKDGSQYRGKRYPPRVITVKYKLMSSSNSAFREAYNKLNGLLDVPESELIFADEPDKYFIGTKASHSEVTPGTNRVIGEIEFYCTDPFKHSTVEKTFPASVNSDGILEATIVNNGTESVPISYEITHNDENGFIGIVSEQGAIELGDITELDGEVVQKSETLIKCRNYADYNVMTTGNGIFYASDYGKAGTFKETIYDGKSWLDISSAGSGLGWHGAAKTITLPADSKGEVGAKNFALQAKVWFRPTQMNQLGIIEYAIADEDGAHLMSIRIARYEPNRNSTYIIFCVGGKELKRVEFNIFASELTTHNSGEFYMSKSGGKFAFNFGGLYSYNFPNLAGKKAKTVSVFIGQRDNYPMAERMRLQYLNFRKDYTVWQDVPNRFGEDSVVYIDGNTTKVYVNGNESAGDIVRGSNFFHTPPGETKVQFYFSDFCKNVPSVTAKIKEAYL